MWADSRLPGPELAACLLSSRRGGPQGRGTMWCQETPPFPGLWGPSGGPVGVAGCPPPCPWGGWWWPQPCLPPVLPGEGRASPRFLAVVRHGARAPDGSSEGLQALLWHSRKPHPNWFPSWDHPSRQEQPTPLFGLEWDQLRGHQAPRAQPKLSG